MSRSIALPVLAVALVALAGLSACERPRDIAVRVSIPGPDSVETPVTGVGLVALPYDRDSVLAALEASAASPRPDTAALLKDIKTKKTLDDDITNRLKAAIAAFKPIFQAD